MAQRVGRRKGDYGVQQSRSIVAAGKNAGNGDSYERCLIDRGSTLVREPNNGFDIAIERRFVDRRCRMDDANRNATKRDLGIVIVDRAIPWLCLVIERSKCFDVHPSA